VISEPEICSMRCLPASRPLPPYGCKAFNSDRPELGATAAYLGGMLIFRQIVPARDRLETRKFRDGDATRRHRTVEQHTVLASCKTLCATFGKDITGERHISVGVLSLPSSCKPK
jgi:hypothetical protein